MWQQAAAEQREHARACHRNPVVLQVERFFYEIDVAGLSGAGENCLILKVGGSIYTLTRT